MATTIPVTSPTDPSSTMLLLAATDHNIPVVESLLKTTSANVFDPETRQTALHVAVASCTPGDTEEELKAAEETLKLLLQNGAIWNDLDVSGETPGCIADRLGLTSLYEIMVEAGVRAELILGRLGGYEELSGGEEESIEGREGGEGGDETELVQEAAGTPQTEVTQLELEPEEVKDVKDVNSKDYLASRLTYHDDKLLDSDNNGVMMEWERGIMEKSVAALVGKAEGKRILNIGFGMGIIDGFFQAKKPSQHVIVEPHPDVLKKMKEDGWDKKEGVEILEGRWQDVLPDLINKGVTFHAIYFDTFAESYDELRNFFSEYVIALLAPVAEGGKFSFFHGLGADRRISYDVYTRVVAMDMFEAGLETKWEVIPLKKDGEDEDDMEEGGKVWDGVRRRYWVIPEYKLPICEFLG